MIATALVMCVLALGPAAHNSAPEAQEDAALRAQGDAALRAQEDAALRAQATTPELGSRSDLRFDLRQAQGGQEMDGVVVILRSLDPVREGLEAPQYIERSLDRGKVSFRALEHGDYEVTIYGRGAELSFSFTHDGSQVDPIRVHMPGADRSGKSVSANPDRLVWGGVGAVTLGGVLLVGALLAVALNPCRSDITRDECQGDLRNAWAATLASVGGAAVGTGITMMVIGHKRRLLLKPGVQIKVNGAALSLQGRF